jgi:hypothetical protein
MKEIVCFSTEMELTWFAFLLRVEGSNLLSYWDEREVVCFPVEMRGKWFASQLRWEGNGLLLYWERSRESQVRNCPGRGRHCPPVDEECPPLVLHTAMLQPVVPLLIHTAGTLIKVTVSQDFRPLDFHLQQQPHPPRSRFTHKGCVRCLKGTVAWDWDGLKMIKLDRSALGLEPLVVFNIFKCSFKC